jgi:DNA transformation protein
MGTRRNRSDRAQRPDASFKDFVLEQLDGLGGVRAQSMFGGWGLYRGEVFFGIVWHGRLFLRTDAKSRPRYEALGMRPFRPNPRQSLQRYYEVPTDVLDPPELARWAREAVRGRGGPGSKTGNEGGSAASE